MKKEDILLKSRLENKQGDEREKKLEIQSDQIGLLTLAIAFLPLLVMKFYYHQPIQDLFFLAAMSGTGASFYRAYKNHDNIYYIAFFIFGILAIVCFIEYWSRIY